MPLAFFSDYGATPVTAGDEPGPTDDYDDELPKGVVLNAERPLDQWAPVAPDVPEGWLPDAWPDEAPVRFIDGRDVGSTVSCVYAPVGGQPVPVRLSQIGATALTLTDRTLRRSFEAHETVVTLVADPFPWDRIEALATDLARLTYRLVPARPPRGQLSYDYETMRKAAQNQSGDAMAALEEAALAADPASPTVVDGRLEPRRGGFLASVHPVVGVIKTHRKRYLPADGMRVLFRLRAGERTPYVILPGTGSSGLSVVSWYLRLGGDPGPVLDQGIIRVEVALARFERLGRLGTPAGSVYADRLSATLRHHRHRGHTYGRAAISLHPIVRAEQSLGACFSDHGRLAARFRRAAF